MRQTVFRMAAPALLVAAVALVAFGSTAIAGKKTFSGKLCSLVGTGELAHAHINGPCVNHKTVVTNGTTPVGRIRQRIYTASAGPMGFSGRYVQIFVDTPLLSGARLATAVTFFRSEVLSNGALFSLKPLGSVFMDTSACPNPPIGDCTKGQIKELVGHSLVIIGIYEPAIFVGPDDPLNPAVDKANDAAQEALIQAPFVAIGRSVAAGL